MGAGTQDPTYSQPERPSFCTGGQEGAVLGSHFIHTAPPLTLGEDLPRPRLEMVLRSVKLLASRTACGSLSVKGSKSLWRQEGLEVTTGEGSKGPFSGP